MLIVGSSALYERGVDIGRVPKDLDLIATPEELEDYKKLKDWDHYVPVSGSKWVFRKDDRFTEVEVAWPNSSAEMLLGYSSGMRRDDVASLGACLMLKLSHRYLKNSPHFLKTMRDIQFLRKLGASLNDDLEYILEVREKETYSYEHPNLNRTKDEFFVDSYHFDHDSLHEAVALYGEPAYKSFKSEHAEVMCDMDKFFECSYPIQVAAVYEEAAVLALERSFIPFGKDEQWAFEMALMKVCTSITSGRFREFAWEHYDEVIELKKNVEVPYTTAFFNGVVSGVIKPESRNG